MRRSAVIFGLAAIVSLVLYGWGPHPEIVDAALSTLPAADRLGERLGADAGRLRLYVWMGDWKDSLVSIQERWTADRQYVQPSAQIYTNDYLIFPLAPKHYLHIAPGVTETYKPFFLRALQALRMETPANAARWIGSLLHFTTDTGAPPHAAGILGEAHTKMENWVDGSQVRIAGYHPQLLGSTDEEAEAGFQRRMVGLIEFSKQREERLRPFIAANDRPHSEPIALESACESARVAADLLHTLLALSAPSSGAGNANLFADLTAPSIPGMEALPAKLLLLDTSYSTTSEPRAITLQSYTGSFELREIPPGMYMPVVYRVGCKTNFGEPIVFERGATIRRRWQLESDPFQGNLVRNADFQIHWVAKDRPDHWTFNASKQGWIADNIKVDAGREYRVILTAADSAIPKVSLQWLRQEWPQELGNPISDFGPEARLRAPGNAEYARLIVHGRDALGLSLTRVAFAAGEPSR